MSLEESVEKKILEIAEEICDRESFVLYDVEYLASQKIVRIFIDKEGGVTLDDCAKVSSGVNFLLDVEDPIESKYNLEVSSPGLERRLSKKWHYEKADGKEVTVVIKARTETSKKLGAKNIKGILTGVMDTSFKIETEQYGVIDCPYEDVHKCNLVFDFDYNFGPESQFNKKK